MAFCHGPSTKTEKGDWWVLSDPGALAVLVGWRGDRLGWAGDRRHSGALQLLGGHGARLTAVEDDALRAPQVSRAGVARTSTAADLKRLCAAAASLCGTTRAESPGTMARSKVHTLALLFAREPRAQLAPFPQRAPRRRRMFFAPDRPSAPAARR